MERRQTGVTRTRHTHSLHDAHPILNLENGKSAVLDINAVSENPDLGGMAKRDSVNRVVADLRRMGLEADVVQLPDELHVPVRMCNVRKVGMITVDWIARKLR